MDFKQLSKLWIERQNLPRDSEELEKSSWILLEIGDLLYESPEQGFKFILEVLNRTDDEWVLTNLAAGPLEDLLAQHPANGIALIEKEIALNPKLKHILQDVWQSLMPEEIWHRLQRLRD